MSTPTPQAIAKRNINLFIAFRTLFNARFYYPIFTVIYLDFGLTIEQFSMLNVIWAITIILAEVPSGALSDLFGRKKLLLFTSFLMVGEMAIWAFAPTSDPTVLFWILAINRILSGLGEASASGSDEALVYDSLEQAGMKKDWSNVLAKTQRFQSFGFMVAMITGGMIYDVGVVQAATNLLGMSLEVTKETILRWPVYLTLVSSIVTLFVAFRFTEPKSSSELEDKEAPKVSEAFKQTWSAAKWIGRTPFALIVIVAGAFADSVIRMFVTLGSEYYRLIEFSPVYFGFIGAGISALSIATASFSKWLIDKHSPGFNFFIITGIAATGFIGATYFIPYVGLIFSIMLFAAFSITMFAVSYYLNHITDKSMRATVLSFKGLAFNMGYGFIGWLFAQLGYFLRNNPELANDKDAHFMASVGYFPAYFIAGSVLVALFAIWRCPRPNKTFREMDDAIDD